MKPPIGDPDLLLRAAGRCMALACELDNASAAVSRASRHVTHHWSGAGADAFGAVTGAQRTTVLGARAVVERLGAISRAFAHGLADEQVRARRADASDPAVKEASEARIALMRQRFRLQLMQAESDLESLLKGRLPAAGPRRTGPPMLTGPVGRLPGEPRWWGPVLPPDNRAEPPPRWPTLPPDNWVRPPWWKWPVLPPDNRVDPPPPRWTGPIRAPGWPIRPNWPLSKHAGTQHLPWTPPWLHGASGSAPAQPIGL